MLIEKIWLIQAMHCHGVTPDRYIEVFVLSVALEHQSRLPLGAATAVMMPGHK